MPSAPFSCRGCRHFVDSAQALEAALPGMSTLSSGYASVRSSDGQCLEHQRLVSAFSSCRSYAGIPAMGDP